MCMPSLGCTSSSGSGTVTSVGLSDTTGLFSITGSPVTTSGTINLNPAVVSANLFYASPDGSSGNASFRSITMDDLSDIQWVTFREVATPAVPPAGYVRVFCETSNLFTGIDPVGNTLDARFRYLLDGSSLISVDPINRVLTTAGGTPTFDWSTTYTPTGNTSVTSAGALSSVLYDTTFDGGLGGNAYTIGDIVYILKSLKILQ